MGVPEWALLVLVFGPGTLLLLARRRSCATQHPILLATWIFRAGALLYCVIVYVVSGIASRAGAGMIAYVVVATVVCLLRMRGCCSARVCFWKLLGQYRAARVRGARADARGAARRRTRAASRSRISRGSSRCPIRCCATT